MNMYKMRQITYFWLGQYHILENIVLSQPQSHNTK